MCCLFSVSPRLCLVFLTDCSALKPAFLGVLRPHRDINPQRRFNSTACAVHVRQGSQPYRLSVRDVSHAFDGLLRCVPCRFISPRSRFQGSPKGVVPPTQPRCFVSSRLPSRRLTTPRYSQLPDCATLCRPALRAFIHVGICLSLAASVTPRRRAVPLGSSSIRFSPLARPYRL